MLMQYVTWNILFGLTMNLMMNYAKEIKVFYVIWQIENGFYQKSGKFHQTGRLY